MYAIRFTLDTWLKASTAQGSELSEDEREFVAAGTVLPLASYEYVGNNHVKIVLGRDAQGQQVQPDGRVIWYVFEPAAEISRVPVIDAYFLEIEVDTWLKLRPEQSNGLSDDEKYLIKAGTVLPIAGFSIEQNHVKVTFGKDANGKQVQFLGRNTWYVYQPDADVLLNGTPIYGYAVKFNTDTWLKQSTASAIDLPDDKKQFIPEKTVLPLSAFQLDQWHLKLTLGKNERGEQIQFKGASIWYVFYPHVTVLHNGQPHRVELTTNEKGIRLIKAFEGLRLNAYQDVVGIWTIGYGTTSGVYPGMVITLAEAEELLKQDLRRFEAAVNQFVKVPLNSDQFSALVAFAYNVGENALASSTLLKRLNEGNYGVASDEFLRWVYAGGQVLAGLVRRRNAERALFRGEDFTVFL